MPNSAQESSQPQAEQAADESAFLPNFCTGRMALTIVLIAELVAILLALAGYSFAESFWVDLARLSMLLLWFGLANAAALCMAQRYVDMTSPAKVTFISMVIVAIVCLIISEISFQIGQRMFPQLALQSIFPSERGPFIFRNLGISIIVSAMVLRYFYVSHQWRVNVQLEARSRVGALAARIRPHFLFNSMNTIAELTRSDPIMAERAVEDLADLFRATLADSTQKVRLKEELEMARMYERIETLRLGDRLKVDWQVDELPTRALIPGISIQPLLENAIYHGIERLPAGGIISVVGEYKKPYLSIMMSNPVTTDSQPSKRSGNHIALNNIRQRFDLAYYGEATVKTSLIDNQFSVYLRFPFTE